MTSYQSTHLKQLEAESIDIIREVAAEFEKPVMLYSIGKDSAVMLRLALKCYSNLSTSTDTDKVCCPPPKAMPFNGVTSV